MYWIFEATRIFVIFSGLCYVLVLEFANAGSLEDYLIALRQFKGGLTSGKTVPTTTIRVFDPVECTMSAQVALDLLSQLFTAVAHCHSQPVVAHRDKPANCLLFKICRPSGYLLAVILGSLSTSHRTRGF